MTTYIGLKWGVTSFAVVISARLCVSASWLVDLHGKRGQPYAGKLHVRFDEGAGVPYGGVPLYSTPFWPLQKQLPAVLR